MHLTKSFLSASFLFFIFLNVTSYSQDIPIKWKDIPKEDLEMTSYSADSAASALILCDFGSTTFNDDLSLIYERHIRVKIFNENGYGLATFTISFYDDIEYIDDIEGYTYWLDESGKVLKAELDEDDIQKEVVRDDLINNKFTMPALKPGCVFEIKYKIVTKSLALVRDWYFQYSEPVRWSEYRLMYIRNITYSSVSRGYEPFYVSESTQSTKVVSGTAKRYSNGSIAHCNNLRWVVKDAPAVRKEPFITCTDDYKNRVEIQLSSYTIPGHGVETFSKTWPKFIKEFLDAKWFGDKISNSGKIKDLSAKITEGITDPEEKIKAIYKWVSSSIVWSGRNTKFVDKSLNSIIDSKEGNSAEINMLLISLLKSANIECDPLVLSTRGNGKIQDLYPIMGQFNYVIARAKVNSKYYFLDATDPERPYDLLPSKVLNVKAIAIKEGPVEWTNLNCDKKNNTKSIANVTIDEQGSLSGYFEVSLGEYRSVDLRNALTEKNQTEAIKEMLDTELYGFEIDSVNILNKDSIDSPLRMLVYVSSDHYIQQGGDLF
jgi:transglutaminase-like putative cysteine protease